MYSAAVTALTMAAVAVAAPVSSSEPLSTTVTATSTQTYPTPDIYSFGIKMNGLTLVAKENGSYFAGYDNPADPTTFFSYGQSEAYNQTLNVNINGTTQQLVASLCGDDTGVASFVVSVTGDANDANWSIYNGSISHTLGAASCGLMACNATINGETEYALSLGSVAYNESLPAGCEFASLNTFQPYDTTAASANVVTSAPASSATSEPISTTVTASSSQPVYTKDVYSFGLRMGYGNLKLVAEELSGGGLQFVGFKEPKGYAANFFSYGQSDNFNQVLYARYKGETYSLFAPTCGDDTGVASPVIAGSPVDGDAEWSVSDGTVMPYPGAATCGLMACNATVDGEEKYVLSFGSTNDNQQTPAGCEFTSLNIFDAKNSTHIPARDVDVASRAAPVVDVVTFGLKMTAADGKNVTLVSTSVGSGVFELVGHTNPNVGSAFFARGSNPTKVLSTRFDGNIYSLSAADPGDDSGNVFPVYGTVGTTQDPNWSIQDGFVEHKMGGASDGFMSCNKVIDGETKSVLSFGSDFGNGTLPSGCVYTTLYTN